jgi:uncharacterized protein (TIGR02246 family)
MKTYLALAVACVSLQFVSTAEAQAPQQPLSHSPERFQSGAQQRAEIEKLLKSYERSLDASDLEGVMKLYTHDGVFMAPGAPTAVGIDAVREGYVSTFEAIDIDITFEIAETKVLSPNWAFLRTTSTGEATILANGAVVPASNQELFIVHKTRGCWKIARYSFSSVLPPA